jgi:hypothetical protein
MKKLLLLLVVVGLAVYFGKGVVDRIFGHDQPVGLARVRVQSMLDAMAAQPANEQAAISWWGEGLPMLDFEGLRRYDLAFGSFWRESGLAQGGGWRIVEATLGSDGQSVAVTVESGGQRIMLTVVPREPIRTAGGS